MESERLKQIIEERKRKLSALRKSGVNPYPNKGERTENISLTRGKIGQKVAIVGRITAFRGHGKIVFLDLKDESEKIQVLLKQDILGKNFELVKYLGIGDFLEVQGEVFKTDSGEITVNTSEFRLLTKSIRPLPDKWHGLVDVEERYRKRYLDLIMNPQVDSVMRKRSKINSLIRNFLDNKGFLEVETPTLQPVYGGGFAKPFITHHNALNSNFYLRISDEMYLKRFVVGGFEKVYEITKVFRNEGVDFDHNPEFTMFEAMIAYEDYRYGMDLIEELVEKICQGALGTTVVEYQGTKLSFKRPWKRYRLIEAIHKFTDIDVSKWKSLDQAKKDLRKRGIEEEKLKELHRMNNVGEVIAFAFEELVEGQLIQPTIIYDYPIEVSPLAKKCEDERFTQRFEMFVCGSEFGNNYTELNDPMDLSKRFVEEKKKQEAGFEEAHQTDYDYLEAIESGMPPTCGIAIGVDRLVMFLTNAKNIKEVIAFPTLRPKDKEGEKKDFSKILQSVNVQSTILWETNSDNLLKIAQVDDKLKQKFPHVKFGVALIKGVKIDKSLKELESYKKEVLSSMMDLTTEQISSFPSIQSYRNFFKAFGVDWKSKRPSPDALLRRVALKKGLYKINTLVDAYNLAVLKTKIGLGAFNLSTLKLPVSLRLAKEGEKVLLLGDEEEMVLKQGEVVYSDQEKVVTVDLNYRDSALTKVTLDTKDIILFSDGCEGISEEEVMAALNKGIELIQRFCGGEIFIRGLVTTKDEKTVNKRSKKYDYRSQKIVAVLNSELSSGQAFNALGHLAFSSGHFASSSWMGEEKITDASGAVHRGIAKYPFIVLKAKKEQIREIVIRAKEEGIDAVDYPQAMFETGHDEDLVKVLGRTKEEEITYHAVVLKGESNVVNELTKGLSLYK